MKNGEELENGVKTLPCTALDKDPVVLELKDFEFINNIYGNGKDFIKSICIETNSYRKIKIGSKDKGPAAN